MAGIKSEQEAIAAKLAAERAAREIMGKIQLLENEINASAVN